MKIYVYAEHCNRRGVVRVPADYVRPDGELSDDVWLWGEGSINGLIDDAKARLETAYSDYMRRTCLAVLDYLGVNVRQFA